MKRFNLVLLLGVLGVGTLVCAPLFAQQPEGAATEVVEPQPAPPQPVPQPAPRPVLEVESRTLDLGTVLEGVVVEGTFVLRNTGTADLKIHKVKPG